MAAIFPFLFVSKAEASPAASWSRSIGDIGFGDGVLLPATEPSVTLYWTVPPAARNGAATLTLVMTGAAHDKAEERIALSLDGAPVAEFVPGPGVEQQTLHIDVPSSALADGVLALTLAQRQRQSCTDAASSRFSLHPESALEIALSGARDAQSRLALLPAAFTARLPQGPATLDEMRNLTLIAASLTRAGHRVSFTQDPAAPAALAFAKEGADVFVDEDGIPTIPAKDEIADRLARTLDDTTPLPVNDEHLISLTALGIDTATRNVRTQAEWTFALPLRDIPAALVPATLELDITAPIDLEGARQSLALELNGQLVASQMLPLRQDTRHVTFPIPRGVLNSHNAMRLVFTRIGLAGLCTQTTLPVSLGPDSLIALGPAQQSFDQFSDFAHLGGPVTLQIEQGLLDQPMHALPFAVALTASTLRDLEDLRFAVAGQDIAHETQPFLYLSQNPPPDAPAQPVSEAASDLPFAKLITLPRAKALWLRPSSAADGAFRIPLDRGDSALFKNDGTTQWYNQRPLSQRTIFSAQSESLRQLIEHYWPWAAALLWIFMSIAALIALARRKDTPT